MFSENHAKRRGLGAGLICINSCDGRCVSQAYYNNHMCLIDKDTFCNETNFSSLFEFIEGSTETASLLSSS